MVTNDTSCRTAGIGSDDEVTGTLTVDDDTTVCDGVVTFSFGVTSAVGLDVSAISNPAVSVRFLLAFTSSLGTLLCSSRQTNKAKHIC